MARQRKSIPMKAQRDAALIQLGLDPATAELDHHPALWTRAYDEETGLYDPDERDPRGLVWRDPDGHKRKTFGNGATTAGSDVGGAAKLKRLTADQEEFRRRMLEKAPGKPPPKSGKRPWPSRPFNTWRPT